MEPKTPAIRGRVVAMLANVAPELAEILAQSLGMEELPQPLPKVLQKVRKAEVYFGWNVS